MGGPEITKEVSKIENAIQKLDFCYDIWLKINGLFQVSFYNCTLNKDTLMKISEVSADFQVKLQFFAIFRLLVLSLV